MSVRSYLQSRNFNVDSVVDFQTLPITDLNGVVVTTTTFSTSIGGNGHKYEYDSSQAKSGHDGYTIISPTVPWDGTAPTLAAFQAGTGETDGAGTGCWVLRDTVREVSGRVRFEGPEIQEDVVTDDQKGVANGVASLDGSGKVPVAELPAGTANGVASLDGTGRVPAGQLPASFGAEVFSANIAAGATIDLPSVLTLGPYQYYRVFLINPEVASGSADVLCRLTDDNGTTYESTNYSWCYTYMTPGGASLTYAEGVSQTSVKVYPGLQQNGGASIMTLDFDRPDQTRGALTFHCKENWLASSFKVEGTGTTSAISTNPITGLQFLLSASTFTATGEIKVYGQNFPFS